MAAAAVVQELLGQAHQVTAAVAASELSGVQTIHARTPRTLHKELLKCRNIT